MVNCMKNFVFLILILIVAGNVFGQKTFDVQDFSEDYYGKVYLEQPAEVFSKGWVAIYQKKTNKQLIKINSEELIGDTEEGKIKANVKELPYGEQSVIIYQDFNFDGVKDFAIMDGQNGCYHTPSFQIYLAGKVKDQFVLSNSFTKLAQENCGMFEADETTKTLSTMTKDGCCWHQSSEYIVVNNVPKVIKIVEDDAMKFPFITLSTQTWDGKRMVKTSERTVDFEDENLKKLFSFKTDNGGEAVLFSYETMLYYAFINKSGKVDFAFPTDSDQEEPKFTIDSKENPTTLSFANKNAVYRIYEKTNEKVGVQVNVNGKFSNIAGDVKSSKGNLRQIVGANLENINFKQ